MLRQSRRRVDILRVGISLKIGVSCLFLVLKPFGNSKEDKEAEAFPFRGMPFGFTRSAPFLRGRMERMDRERNLLRKAGQGNSIGVCVCGGCFFSFLESRANKLIRFAWPLLVNSLGRIVPLLNWGRGPGPFHPELIRFRSLAQI